MQLGLVACYFLEAALTRRGDSGFLEGDANQKQFVTDWPIKGSCKFDLV